MLVCTFCSKECKNLNAKSQHELYCKKNPNAKKKVPSYGMKGKVGAFNQYSKAKSEGFALRMSDDAKQKISEASKKQVWSEERKKNHSLSMREAVKEHPESYSSGNRGRVKRIEVDGISLQGSWEVAFYNWAKEMGYSLEKCTESFTYTFEGVERKYFPDFYLNDLDAYVEVKGYKTSKDEAKWSQFPRKLLVIDSQAIYKIKKKVYNLTIPCN